MRVDPARQRALLAEQQVVAVDHAGGVDLARHESAGGVALAADVVAVQPDADVEAPHAQVGEPLAPQERQRDQRRLRGVDRAHRRPSSPARSARDDAGESARTTTTEVRSWSVSRMIAESTRRPCAAASRSLRTHASGEFHAAWMWPATRSSTWRS